MIMISVSSGYSLNQFRITSSASLWSVLYFITISAWYIYSSGDLLLFLGKDITASSASWLFLHGTIVLVEPCNRSVFTSQSTSISTLSVGVPIFEFGDGVDVPIFSCCIVGITGCFSHGDLVFFPLAICSCAAACTSFRALIVSSIFIFPSIVFLRRHTPSHHNASHHAANTPVPISTHAVTLDVFDIHGVSPVAVLLQIASGLPIYWYTSGFLQFSINLS